MVGSRKMMTTAAFVRELKEKERSILEDLGQCGMALRSEIDEYGKKRLIVEPRENSKTREIVEAVVGNVFDFKITIEAASSNNIDEESQIVHFGLSLVEEISKAFVALFYAMLEHGDHGEELYKKIAEIDPDAVELIQETIKDLKDLRASRENLASTGFSSAMDEELLAAATRMLEDIARKNGMPPMAVLTKGTESTN